MRWIKAFFTTIGIMIAGMFGGQKNKGVRRFGIPLGAICVSLFNKFQWRDLGLLLLIPILAMGYGVDSVYMKLFHVEWLVRLAYALTLSIPFIFYGWRRLAISAIALSLAYSVRAGSLGFVSWFGDILIEDIVRYSTLGALISFNIFFRQASRQKSS